MSDDYEHDGEISDVRVDYLHLGDTLYRVAGLYGDLLNDHREMLVMHQPVDELLEAQEEHQDRLEELYEQSVEEDLYVARGRYEEGDDW